jgi:proline iminopeptidase
MPGYPPIEPYDWGLLDVGDGHRIYWEICGNPAGKPAVFLHGGPGSGCSPGHRRMFDPDRYRVVLFDQRNCGRSLPHAGEVETDLTTNTTEALLDDIERLRELVGVERWLVWGGSWGSTLAVSYAERHPERVSEVVLVAVTNTRAQDVDWLYGGVGRYFPEAWERFRTFVGVGPAASGTEVVTAYDEVLQGRDPALRERAAIEWCRWEEAVAAPDAERKAGGYLFEADPRKRLAFARLCAHYFAHHAWLGEDELLENAGRLAGIPAVLVHGRLDLGGSTMLAWELARAWPGARLEIIEGAGHATGPGLGAAIGAALDDFAADWPETITG